jgi:hypothetical protein
MMMIDNKDYVVSKEKWDEARAKHGLIGSFPGASDLIDKWNLRTSGSGDLYKTLLYALRAHKRGKVHCHDMDHDQQGEWLKKAEPFLSQFLVEREPRSIEPLEGQPLEATA